MKFTQFAAGLVIIILSGILPSCKVPDPMFLRNAGNIQGINYPSSMIVGTWVSMSVPPLPSDTLMIEDKSYYDIYPGGRGRVRQSSKNLATGNFIAMEADFTWDYQEANCWRIMMPPSSKYKITDSRAMTMGSMKAREFQVSYYQGDLYEMTTEQIWVIANAENISRLAKRLREKDLVLHISLN